MCAPMLILPTLLAGLALGGAKMEADGQREAGRANQQIANNNARMSEQAAKDAAILGARDSQQATWRTRALLGKQLATIAANGIDSDSGTPFELLGETALFGGAEKSAIEMDAARKAWGFQAEATNFRNQGKLARWQGNQSAKATILGGLGNAIGQFGGSFFGKKPGAG